jgi:hypothetical protein
MSAQLDLNDVAKAAGATICGAEIEAAALRDMFGVSS